MTGRGQVKLRQKKVKLEVMKYGASAEQRVGRRASKQKEGSACHPEGPCGGTEINVVGVGRKATQVLKAMTGIRFCPKCRKRSLQGSGGGGRMGVEVDVPLPIRPGKPSQEDERAVDDASVSPSRHPCTRSNY